MVHMILTSLVGLLTAVAAAQGHNGQPFPDCETGPLRNNTVCNTGATVKERAQSLINILTLQEKVGLVTSGSPGVPRLGIAPYDWWNEALHGVANSSGVRFASSGNYSYATSFPQPILMGAAFDDELIRDVADVISTEARAFNNGNMSGINFWTPNINPYRDPRWGRGQEVPSEDQFHIKSYTTALIEGLEGKKGDDYLKVVATCKHFAGYDLENWNGNERYGFNSIISSQELTEYYIQPFQACARDSRVSAIMCTYHALNGVPTCANEYLLKDILRGHWDWNEDHYHVVSDCDSIQNVFLPHGYSSTRAGAAADSLLAGTDLNCGTYYDLHLPYAYDEGLFDDTTINQAVSRLVSAQIRLGMYDPPGSTPYRSLSFADVGTPHANNLALKAAEKGIVLLKNDGTLPLQLPVGNKTLTVAVIGNWANFTDELLGNYAGIPREARALVGACESHPNIKTLYARPGDPVTRGFALASEIAHEADVVFYMDGARSDEEQDRHQIEWTGAQRDIVAWVASLGKPTVLIHGGDQLDSKEFLENDDINAMMWVGYPGQSGGDAILNIILGHTAPAGRLPVTQYPGEYVRQVPMTDMNLRPNATSGNPGRTYMWYDKAVLPFGHGLHYTTFQVDLVPGETHSWDTATLAQGCNARFKDLCPFVEVPVTVTNAGLRTSDYVALGFMSGTHGPEPYPIKRLVAYERLSEIASNSTQTANLQLTFDSLARRNERGDLVLYPGEYSLAVDVSARTWFNFTLTGDEITLEVWPQDNGPRVRH